MQRMEILTGEFVLLDNALTKFKIFVFLPNQSKREFLNVILENLSFSFKNSSNKNLQCLFMHYQIFYCLLHREESEIEPKSIKKAKSLEDIYLNHHHSY